MKLGLTYLCAGTLALVLTMIIPSQAVAQNPPPAAIFDLATSPLLPSNAVLNSYTLINTSFVGDGSNEYVSFAFRDQPAYFAFDDASITAAGSSTNLLINSGFEQGVTTGPADVRSNYPDGWQHWIQPVDTSLIGAVAANGCGVEVAHTGNQFWCDGSEVGYDGICQAIATSRGTTYNISFWLDESSNLRINSPGIDMLVYAGDQIPVGSTLIADPLPPLIPPPSSTPPPPVIADTPEPASFALMGGGLVILGLAYRRRTPKI